MRVREILRITGGVLLSGDTESEIDPSRFSTDSRTVRKGDFFIALEGSNFDGGDFVADAFKKGATGTLVVKVPTGIKDSSKVVIRVADTATALQEIAHHHRMGFSIPVVCVTGSNGKTTVKEMIWTILSSRYVVLRNEGTKNNHIGVPQTLLKLNDSHQICVLEFGTNHKGEIRRLSDIARPTMAVITNIGPSHLEFLKDINGVFDAKTEMLEFLDKGSNVILNGDDRYLLRIRNKGYRIARFGFDRSNDFRATAFSMKGDGLEFSLNGKFKVRLKVLGRHNIYNALAAIATASCFGITGEEAGRRLAGYKSCGMRLNLQKINGLKVLNDSYNSNPLSMKAALEVLRDYPARARWVVLGDMLELGDKARYFHTLIGKYIATSDVNGLVAMGRLSRYALSGAASAGMAKERLWHCLNYDGITSVLRKVARRGDAILLKGSRSMKMEEVLTKLAAHSS